MDREHTKSIFRAIRTIYPNFQASPEAIDAWFHILRETEVEDCLDAVRQKFSEPGQWAPSPGDILEIARNIKFARTGVPANGEQAWDLIKGIITRNRHDPDKTRANAEAAKIGLDFQLCIKAFGYGRIRECIWPAQQGRGLTTPEVEQRRRQFVDHWTRWHTNKASAERPRLTDGAMKMIQGGAPCNK